MIKYDWNCKTVDARPLEDGEIDVVYNVHWIVTGISDELKPDGSAYSATSIGTQNVPWNPEGAFIPFEDLTNEIVVGWTQTAMGPVKMATFESNIAEQIELLINPVSINLYIPIPDPPDPELP